MYISVKHKSNVVTGFQRHVIQQFAELRAAVGELSKQLVGVNATLNAIVKKDDSTSHQKCCWFLNSVVEVEKLEERLVEKTQYGMVRVFFMSFSVLVMAFS